MYHYMMNSDVAEKRLQRLMNEADESRQTSQYEVARNESKVINNIRTYAASMWRAMNQTVTNANAKPSDQPVKNSL